MVITKGGRFPFNQKCSQFNDETSGFKKECMRYIIKRNEQTFYLVFWRFVSEMA